MTISWMKLTWLTVVSMWISIGVIDALAWGFHVRPDTAPADAFWAFVGAFVVETLIFVICAIGTVRKDRQ